MIMKTLKKGFRMAEVPTHEHKRKMGYSKISLKKVWFRYVYSLVKYLLF
jgi:dolichol-phosphate mannosyltransferase